MLFNENAGMFDLRIYMVTHLAFPHVLRPAITISHGIFWDFPHSEYRSLDEGQRQEWLRRNLYGFTAPDVCVAVDSNVRRVIQAMEPGAESRTHVIANFVDTNQFRPSDVKRAGEQLTALYPRRLTSLRGSNDFLRATRDYPQYQYVACGQAADAAMEEQAQAWAKTTPHVRMIWRPMDEMPLVYQDADIAVVPTKAAEGLSLSLLEAMATGLPIITTPVGGIGDAVIDGYNAVVYDPNHEDLGAAIHDMAKNSDLRAKMGIRNREIAVECFDINIWRAKWANLIAAFA
jgi:glycosyltransferase involved in cell wall biosynthesis